MPISVWIILAILQVVYVGLFFAAFRTGRASGRQIEHAYRQREMRTLKGALCWWDEKEQAMRCSFPNNTPTAVMEEFASRFNTWGNGGLGPDALTRAIVESDLEDFAANLTDAQMKNATIPLHRYERQHTDY